MEELFIVIVLKFIYCKLIFHYTKNRVLLIGWIMCLILHFTEMNLKCGRRLFLGSFLHLIQNVQKGIKVIPVMQYKTVANIFTLHSCVDPDWKTRVKSHIVPYN